MSRESKSELQIKKIIYELQKNEYIRASDLAKKCRFSTWTIYKLIRKIKESGIGIIGTRKGLILSEFAKLSDDVQLMRKCMGRRASDAITIEAAKKDILSRWNTIPKGPNNLTPLLGHLTLGNKEREQKAIKGLQYLLSYVNEKGL